MQRDYNAILEKSVWDLLQYKNNGSIEQVIRTVFEAILKAEQKGFLGYEPGQRTSSCKNKRNGYRQSGLIKGISQHFRIQIPRDRLGLFKPVFLDILQDETKKLDELAFALYVKGLSTREISRILQEIYGKNLSSTGISNITQEYEQQMKGWLEKPLESKYYALYIDGLRVPIRRDTVCKETFYIILGLRTDLRREILGMYLLPEETQEGWKEVLSDIYRRGVKEALLVISDEFTGIDSAIEEQYPNSQMQYCITHKKRNILKQVRRKDRQEILRDFDQVLDMDNPLHTVELAQSKLKKFVKKWSKIYRSIPRMFSDREEYFTYLKYPYAMRRMIYTNNWIENVNRMIRRTTKIRGSFPNPESAKKLVLFKCLEIEDHFMKYPVTSLLSVQDQLEDMFVNYDPVLKTHST